MKQSLSILIFLCCSFSLFSQSKEVEEMWRHRIDTSRIHLIKPSYLDITEDEASRLLDKQPSFGLYKDSYIITGFPTNKQINKYTADAKFQVSIHQRLVKSVLPFNTFLMLTYTQKSFWNIYESSAPFADINFNPGFLLGKVLVHNNQLRGMASLSFEHESNGKDSINSRSWNYFVLSTNYFFNIYLSGQAKLWAGWAGNANKDLYKYRGYGLIALNYRSLHDKFWMSVVLNPCSKALNTQVELSFKMSPKANQYFFLQWYNGYGESLLEYNQYSSMIRVGICLKPPLRNFY